MINLLVMLAAALIALLLVLTINRDAIVAIALPIIGLAAPPTSQIRFAGLSMLRSMLTGWSKWMEQKLGLFCNGRLPVTWVSGPSGMARFMGDYLKIGASRSAESSHIALLALLAPARTAAMTGNEIRSLKSRSEVTMTHNSSHLFADIVSRIVSFLEQTLTMSRGLFPTANI